MQVKTGDKVLYCEEEYDVIKVDDDPEAVLNILIEDNCGYRLWVSCKDVKIVDEEVILCY